MSKELHLGIDIGSTTVKIAVIDSETRELLYHDYQRHNARQAASLTELLKSVRKKYPDAIFKAAACGSGAKNIALEIGATFIQEVVANSVAIKQFYQQTRVAIELGGQDAKIIFFYYDEHSQNLIASDMRMNGSCAGGTGAFIDEVAKLLKISVTEFNDFASKGQNVYDISGRCGVFAKTDIQPLLNQGVSREDVALSTFHAIAKQSIGGLAAGLEIKPPVIFEGGPLTFNPVLIDVFAERLGLEGEDVIKPENPEIVVAQGTAVSINTMQGLEVPFFDISSAIIKLENYAVSLGSEKTKHKAFFNSGEEKDAFLKRYELPEFNPPVLTQGSEIPVYIGIDAGSTTTKFVVINQDEEIIYKYYTHNDGEPLKVIQKAFIEMDEAYNAQQVSLQVKGVGVTGYGELLFAKALKADYHMVETVAHAKATMKYFPDASFILDIGGQDMKAIQIRDGIVTGITLNEACSAGCGSFLENFASTLNIPVEEIAEYSFKSKAPSELGSRCTVFMNSSIITEQKNGKLPEDIIGGLCRSIIDNVFNKVIRNTNMSFLGNKIVVQGGTFKNAAVLRALEQYTNINVERSPFPGEMGALGIALLTKDDIEEKEIAAGSAHRSGFIGFQSLKELTYKKKVNYVCNFCTNNCNRTVITFNTGENFVTGNRCERGEIIGDINSDSVKEEIKAKNSKIASVADLMKYREQLLFKNYYEAEGVKSRDTVIGIPRVLEFWNSFPFWNTFFQALGFTVKLSAKSNRKLYERGLKSVSSDTICYPAKLVHGHIYDLIDKKVDRIFMPIMNRLQSENTERLSTYVCAVVKGYPMTVRVSDEPYEKYGIHFDAPNFHWLDDRARDLQIIDFMKETYNISAAETKKAIKIAAKALDDSRRLLVERGADVLEQAEKENKLVIVIAGRPYHNDNFINHDLSHYFTRLGIPVLPLDALPGVNDQDLTTARLDINNNFHTRILNAGTFAARNPNLELVQIVSFGCGHDAILSDELVRLMKEISGKAPLILKLDESNTSGSINIRTKSFIETLIKKREAGLKQDVKPLPDPYEVKFLKEHKKEKVILIPNLSETFSIFASAIMKKQGLRAERLPLADENAFKLGKKYVHNDICFPAQVNIGEFLNVLERGDYSPDEVAFGLGKGICDCRYAQYAVLARKALDDAGYPQVPIMSVERDTKGMYPGLNLGDIFQYRMAWGICIQDALEALLHRIRPYEVNEGDTRKCLDTAVQKVAKGFEKGVKHAVRAYQESIASFNAIETDMSRLKPKVFIIGEILMNFHPASNNFLVRYLEEHGMEVILPYMINKFRMEYLRAKDEMKSFHVRYPFAEALMPIVSDAAVKHALNSVVEIAKECKYFHEEKLLEEYAPGCEHLVHKTFVPGEGWMIAGEITELAQHGINNFIIIQPFGCLPNHITGRGMVKGLKKDFPHIQILALDYDPDTSAANLENRLQMLIINAYERERIIKTELSDKTEAAEAVGASND